MTKLSVLIFCRDDVEKAILLVKDLIDISDQIVLVDSGTKANNLKLIKFVKNFKSNKIDLYRTISVGYADPMRAYGLQKCRNEWVLYIDTDERINLDFKKEIKKIIGKTKVDAFAIKRYEDAHINGNTGDFFTWQIRLYNRNKIEYRGLLHEQPLVKGRLGRLDEKYFMMHVEELKMKGTKSRDLEYSMIKKYDRLSYLALNKKLMEYMGKLFVPEDKKMEDTNMGKFVSNFMKFYEKVTLRNVNDEVSIFDYFMLYSLIEGSYVIKRKSLGYLFNVAFPTVTKDTKEIDQIKKGPRSVETFEIAKKIEEIGIIKYLMLDKENIVQSLNKKYANKKQGISLLIKLLEDRYNSKYP